MTLDVDILPSPDSSNLARLASALRDLDAHAISADRERRPLDVSHPEGLAIGDMFLETRFGSLDLVNGERPDLIRYRRLAKAALTVDLAGGSFKVISKADLIAMKREAGRPKDLRDIAALTEAERTRGGPEL